MIWCLGMYASGSTWLYNTTRDVARIAAAGAPVTACYAETMKMLQPVRGKSGIIIVKTHDLDRKAGLFMTQQASTILLTIRDPRDAVVSMRDHMGQNFAQALTKVEKSALYCGSFTSDSRVSLLRYESGFIDNPATLQVLSKVFGGSLNVIEQAGLFAGSRRAAIEEKIAHLDELSTTVSNAVTGDTVDMDTQWHRHHAHRTGEVGKWRRMLSDDEVRLIEQRLGGWMLANGYELSSGESHH